jgi:hypothetical protein
MKKIVLESAKGVKGGKVQLTFSQIVETGATSTNILGALNADDERFNQQKPRYAWLTVSPVIASQEFGIELSKLKEGDELQLDIVDPRMASNPDQSLNLQIMETTKGSDHDIANFETRAKRAGKGGDFILSEEGEYIYVNTLVVAGTPNHRLLANTKRSNTGVATAINSALED